MKIAIDLDSVQSHFLPKWVKRYNEIYRDNLDYLDILDWDISKFTVKCTKKQLYDILSEDNFFSNIEPVEGAFEVIEKLRANKHDVVTVTAYFPEVCIDKSIWLRLYHGFKKDDIMFCNKKYFISADLLLDDGAHNFKGFNGIKVLYDSPHNQDTPEYEYDIRVHTWREFEIYCRLNGIL